MVKEIKDKYGNKLYLYTQHIYKPQSEAERNGIVGMFTKLNLSYLYNTKDDDYKALILSKTEMTSKTIHNQSDRKEIGKVYPVTPEELALFQKHYKDLWRRN